MTPSITVDVEDAGGNLLATDHSNVTLTIATGPTGGSLGGTVTVAAVDGVATFSNLDLTTAGAYTLTAGDGSLTAATSNSFTIAPAAANHLAVVQQPSNITAGGVISPSVTIDVFDAYGNLVTGDTSNVTLALAITPGTPGSTPRNPRKRPRTFRHYSGSSHPRRHYYSCRFRRRGNFQQFDVDRGRGLQPDRHGRGPGQCHQQQFYCRPRPRRPTRFPPRTPATAKPAWIWRPRSRPRCSTFTATW